MSEQAFHEGTGDGTPTAPTYLTAFTVVVDQSGCAWALLDPPEGISVSQRADHRAVKSACIEIADAVSQTQIAQIVAASLPKPPEIEIEPAAPRRMAEALARRALPES